jgi:hypothetical protein
VGPRAGMDGVDKNISFAASGIWTPNGQAFRESLLTNMLS